MIITWDKKEREKKRKANKKEKAEKKEERKENSKNGSGNNLDSMLAYLDEVAVIGLPACGMYSKITVFDLILPRILAGEMITKKDIAAMGYGGLCLGCPSCSYPHCPFGKGGC